MIDAFDTYIKYVPDAPELVKIKYRKARIFYDYNHFDEAIKLFADIVDHHVNDELAIYSANLLLDCLNIMKRYKELLATVEKYLGNPVLMKDQEFRKQMVSLKTDSLVAEAKQYEKEKNYKECGISFVAAAETIPDHKDHAQRLYNAGLCFQNARLVGQAIKAREAAHRRPPEGHAGPARAVPDRVRLPPAGLLLRGGQALRGVRQASSRVRSRPSPRSATPTRSASAWASSTRRSRT